MITLFTLWSHMEIGFIISNHCYPRCKMGWVVIFTPQPRYTLGKRLQYPSGRRLGVPHNQSGRLERGKNLLTLPEIEPRSLSPPTCVLEVICTELSCLLQILNRRLWIAPRYETRNCNIVVYMCFWSYTENGLTKFYNHRWMASCSITVWTEGFKGKLEL
jgi:hypothetical protein